MLPSQIQLCRGSWWTPPDLDYTFKHSFSWPPSAALQAQAAQAPQAASTTGTSQVARLASSGVAEAVGVTAASLAGAGVGGHLPPPRGPGPFGMHYHQYGAYGPGRIRRRGFGMRRFIWFGLGIGAATVYFRHKENKKEYERRITDRTERPKSNSNDEWYHQYENRYQRFERPSPSPIPKATSVMAEAGTKAVPNESAILSALADTTASIRSSKKSEVEEERPRLGWGHHRRQRRAQREKEASGPNSTSVEMKDLEAAVEKMWNEKNQKAEEAEEKTKEFAREKVESLSKALETLRGTLMAETEKKGERKWV